jgi:hypothetical protein
MKVLQLCPIRLRQITLLMVQVEAVFFLFQTSIWGLFTSLFIEISVTFDSKTYSNVDRRE